MPDASPVLVVVAGPNGSGKSTFFETYLADLGLPYVNADRVARQLRDADPTATTERIDRRAFTTAEALRRAFIAARLAFCPETVFSDPVGAKVKMMTRARARGFVVFLVFIGIDGPELSVARVKQRVEHGGHDVADAKLHARFPRTLANLRSAVATVDEAFLFDDGSADHPYRIAAVYAGGKVVSQHAPLPGWTRGLRGLAPEAGRRR